MNKLFYLKSAEDFLEALLLGNGRIGVTAYGGVNKDVYALNDDTLWSGYPRPETRVLTDDFKKLQSLVLEGDFESAQNLWTKKISGRWSQCYLPAGNLVIRGEYPKTDDYKRELTLNNALHTVRFGEYKREAFVSAPDDLFCISYSGGRLPDLEITLDGILKPHVYCENSTLFMEGEAPGDGIPAYIKDRGEHHIYSDDPAKKGMRYAVGVRVKTDGDVMYLKDCITVKNAHELFVCTTIKTSFAGIDRHPYLDGIDYKSETVRILDRALDFTYSELKNRHIDDFSALFNRVIFEIDGGREDLPTDKRLMLHQNTPDQSLYALIYQFGRYLAISSSRAGTQATNLQGIWNILPTPPWSCNYTVNINTQMNYWGMLGANLAECCEPLNSLIIRLSESGKAVAKNIFGADGFCVNHNVDIWGHASPVGEWNPKSTRWSYFPLAGAWLARHLYEYYIDTKDVEFINGKAFDAIMGSARFCDSMLKDVDGKLIFTPANSPENVYIKDGVHIDFSKYSAMYQSVVRDIFEICIEICNETDREKEYARYLEKRLQIIPWLEMTYDGRIAEWDGDKEESDIHHRHISHLYSFYPAKKVTDPTLIKAAKNSLDKRGDRSTGWSCAWKLCLWASFGDNERALKLCDELMNFVTDRGMNMHDGGGLYPNLLCAHPPFQIDGNFGYVAGVTEMLKGFYEQKASVPKLWKDGRVKGIRINGKTVDFEWKDGKIIQFTD